MCSGDERKDENEKTGKRDKAYGSSVFVGEVYERLKEHLEIGFDAVYHFELYNQLKSLHHEIRNNDPYLNVADLSRVDNRESQCHSN